jgi:hypothetical protein
MRCPEGVVHPQMSSFFLCVSHRQHVPLRDIEGRGVAIWIRGVLKQNRVVRLHLRTIIMLCQAKTTTTTTTTTTTKPHRPVQYVQELAESFKPGFK